MKHPWFSLAAFLTSQEERQDAAADDHGPPGRRPANLGGPEAAVRGQHHELRGTQGGGMGAEKRPLRRAHFGDFGTWLKHGKIEVLYILYMHIYI